MKKILHICSDEKFIDDAINVFEENKFSKNEYIVLSKNKNLKYIKSDLVMVMAFKFFFIKASCGFLKKYNAIVFHSMNASCRRIQCFIPKKTKVCWIGFGFDYYHVTPYSNNKSRVFRFIENKLLRVNDIYRKVDVFCPVLNLEFDFVKSKFSLISEFFDWNYSTSNEIIEDFFSRESVGDSILLGNSGSPTNYHLEILSILKEKNIKNEIIIPLSYGVPEYISKVISYAESTGLNVTFLREFMTQKNYFDILSRCSYTIMNHDRQQGMGNVVSMLALGNRIFLRSESIVSKHLKSMGVFFSSIEDLKIINEFKPLNKDETKHNKKIMIDSFNQKKSLEKTDKLISVLIDG